MDTPSAPPVRQERDGFLSFDSVQRRNLSRGFELLRAIPGSSQLFLMHGSPLCHQPKRPWRKMPMQYGQTFDSNHSFFFTIRRVEMRRRMVIEVHPNNDSIESGDFRHLPEEPLHQASLFQRTCQSTAYTGHPGTIRFPVPRRSLQQDLCGRPRSSPGRSKLRKHPVQQGEKGPTPRRCHLSSVTRSGSHLVPLLPSV